MDIVAQECSSIFRYWQADLSSLAVFSRFDFNIIYPYVIRRIVHLLESSLNILISILIVNFSNFYLECPNVFFTSKFLPIIWFCPYVFQPFLLISRFSFNINANLFYFLHLCHEIVFFLNEADLPRIVIFMSRVSNFLLFPFIFSYL